MTLTGSAEENLKVIRSLMERATVYRTISVPGALWAGGLSVAAYGIHRSLEAKGILLEGRGFLGLWLAVMILTLVINGLLLKREANRASRSFFSPGLRAALRGLLPSFLVAVLITIAGWRDMGHGLFMAWMLFYGLGLLGTQHFAPRSLCILGWAFVVVPFVMGIGWMAVFGRDYSSIHCSLGMALTFGLFHLIYALCVHLSLCRERAAQS